MAAYRLALREPSQRANAALQSLERARHSLLPTMMEHLAEACVILMDDTHRRAEQHIIDAWTECRCLKANRIGRFGTHAEVVFC